MVAVEMDSNYIDVEPLKSRNASNLTDAYKKIWERWKATKAVNPNWHVLDNEASAQLKQAIKENKCTVELTPPNMHRRNIAERAIQTYKNHFVSILAGLEDTFPIHQWDRLVPQAVLTLNLLRQANVAPHVSAYAYLHEQYDYNRMPLAPLGCAVQFHVKPKNRKTWGEHSMDGWYVRTSPEHYRCHEIFVKATRNTRISDTVFFKHKYITQPTITPEDAIMKALQDIRQAISGKSNTKGQENLQALERMTQALEKPRNNEKGSNNDALLQRIQQLQQRAATRVERQENIPQGAPRVESKRDVHPSPRVESQVQQQAVPQVKVQQTQNGARDEVQHQDLIADRVRARRAQAQQQPQVQQQDSVAERVKARRRGIAEIAAMCEEMNYQANAVLDMETGKLLEYRQLLKHPKFKEDWNVSAANKFGQLAQGIGGRIKGTDTIKLIKKSDVPQDRFKDVTYIKFVCTVRTEKKT